MPVSGAILTDQMHRLLDAHLSESLLLSLMPVSGAILTDQMHRLLDAHLSESTSLISNAHIRSYTYRPDATPLRRPPIGEHFSYL